MAYEVTISDGITTYDLPAPSLPDGYQETILPLSVMRVLCDGSVALQMLSYQRVVTFDFKWVAVDVVTMATIMNAFDAVSRTTDCQLTAPNGNLYTVIVSPDQKSLRKRIYKAHGALVYDVQMTLRAVW